MSDTNNKPKIFSIRKDIANGPIDNKIIDDENYVVFIEKRAYDDAIKVLGEFQNTNSILRKRNEELKAQAEKLAEALEFACGNNCHPEHNPCNSREALSHWADFKAKQGVK